MRICKEKRSRRISIIYR